MTQNTGMQHDEGLIPSKEDLKIPSKEDLETRTFYKAHKGYFGVEPAREDEDWGKKIYVCVYRY